jgi:hypothetical protein
MAQPANTDIRPTVLHPIELADFIQHSLKRMTRSTHLIICSSQDDFLQQLLSSIHREKDTARVEAEAAGFEPASVDRLVSRPHELLIPTLHQLASSSNVQVTFCSTLSQLQAYLSTYHLRDKYQAHSDSTAEHNRSPTLALVNLIALHKNMASFSAQGLGRTFASAIEAAVRSKAKLLIVECPNRAQTSLGFAGEGSDDVVHEAREDRFERVPHGNDQQDPWEEEVAILNVTTKNFGAGERGWVGRTVKIRRVVERWCVFERSRT